MSCGEPDGGKPMKVTLDESTAAGFTVAVAAESGPLGFCMTSADNP